MKPRLGGDVQGRVRGFHHAFGTDTGYPLEPLLGAVVTHAEQETVRMFDEIANALPQLLLIIVDLPPEGPIADAVEHDRLLNLRPKLARQIESKTGMAIARHAVEDHRPADDEAVIPLIHQLQQIFVSPASGPVVLIPRFLVKLDLTEVLP